MTHPRLLLLLFVLEYGTTYADNGIMASDTATSGTGSDITEVGITEDDEKAFEEGSVTSTTERLSETVNGRSPDKNLVTTVYNGVPTDNMDVADTTEDNAAGTNTSTAIQGITNNNICPCGCQCWYSVTNPDSPNLETLFINCSGFVSPREEHHNEPSRKAPAAVINSIMITLDGLELANVPLENLCRFATEATEVSVEGGNMPQIAFDDFACVKQLNALHVQKSGIQKIDIATVALLHIEVLDLSRNDIFQVEDTSAVVIPTTQTLAEKDGQSKPRRRVGYVPALKALNLAHNVITIIHKDLFAGFDGIEKLDLRHNRIGSLSSVLLAFPLGNLVDINLSFNKLRKVAMDDGGSILKWAASLVNLNLSHNEIARIDAGLFSCHLHSLTCLDLTHNRLSLLPKYAFSRLHKLKSLDMSHNLLFSLNGEAFGDDPLTTCSFGGKKGSSLLAGFNDVNYGKGMENEAAKPSSEMSYPWPQLDTVNFSHNNISSIAQGTFGGSLSSTKHLFLSHNRIRQLPKYGIESIKRLERLELQHNEIDWLDVGTFTNAFLSHIDLSRNKLRKIISMAFLFLPRIQFINLSHNQLNYIYVYSFYRICKKQHVLNISLSYNELQNDVIWKVWQTFRHLEQTGCSVHVDLHHNQISRFFEASSLENLQKHFALQDVPYFFSWDYLDIAIGVNPITCDCILYQEIQTLRTIRKTFQKSLAFPEHFDFWKSTKCADPSNYNNTSILDSVGSLDCLDVRDCPLLCECFHRTLQNVTYVNCSHRNLNLFPEVLPIGPKELDFKSNKLTAIPPGLNLANVTFMDFSANLLIQIDAKTWKHMTGMVNTILLHNNSLSELPNLGADWSVGSTNINLAGNPFSCLCTHNWMPGWIFHNRHAISDYRAITCQDGRPIIWLRRNDFVCIRSLDNVIVHKPTLNVPVLVFAIVLLLCCTFVVIISVFKRVYCSSKRKSTWRKLHIEHEKKYDVFFMLNPRDYTWTERAIASRLVHEKNYPSQRILIQQSSGPIFSREKLLSGIENSKSVIIVISKAFISEELHDPTYAAISLELLQSISNIHVYIVFLDNAQLTDLGPEMCRLVRTRRRFSVDDDDSSVDQLLQMLPPSTLQSVEGTPTSTTALMQFETISQTVEDRLDNV